MSTAITILNKANVPTGPFTREQVAEKLRAGEFSLEDLAFVEGLSQWTPLREVLAKVDGAATFTPPVFTPPAVPAIGAPAYSYAATMQPPGHLVYAGFWLRFVAYFIDGLIIGIPIFILILINNVLGAGAEALSGNIVDSSRSADSSLAVGATKGFGMVLFGVGLLLLQLVFWSVEIGIAWIYFAKLESGPHQATYGKRALGLKVTNLSGERITFGNATGRFFGKIVSELTLCIGFIMAGFTERKQALHDMLAGTLVVRK